MKFTKPKSFEYNSVVIGAGSAGLVTSYITALLKAKVALIEKHKMGGDCLNTGCVPSKALIKSAKVFGLAKNAKKYGLKKVEIEFDFKDLMQRVQSVIEVIEPHDSVERYEGLGVECIEGEATIKTPWQVEVNGRTLTTKNIVIATGARPLVPAIDGLKDVKYVTSDNLWKLTELPKRFLVLGGGPIGCELAQCFARFGSQVTIVEKAERLMTKEDPEVSRVIEARFKEEGIRVLTKTTAENFELRTENQATKQILIASGEQIEFDVVLVALGRKPNTQNMGFENLDLEFNDNGTLKVDAYLRTTKYKNIFACGDVAGPYQLTHMASHQAWFTSINSMFQPFKKFKVDYSVVPWATFTDPEVATVGLTEIQAKQEKVDFEVTQYDLAKNDRAVAESENEGFVRVITKKGTDKILGASIVAPAASDMLMGFVSAMKHNYGLNKIMSTTHPYPNFSEANKFAASQWKQKHKPEWVFKYLKMFHSWRRS